MNKKYEFKKSNEKFKNRPIRPARKSLSYDRIFIGVIFWCSYEKIKTLEKNDPWAWEKHGY